MIFYSKRAYSLCAAVMLSLFSFRVYSAVANTTVHVIPVTYDTRVQSDGWKALLKQVNGTLSDFRAGVLLSKAPEQHAYDILKNQIGDMEWIKKGSNQWLPTIQAANSPDIFCFYQVDYKDFKRQDFAWIRISNGLIPALPPIPVDAAVQRALAIFLQSQGGAHAAGPQTAPQHPAVAPQQAPVAPKSVPVDPLLALKVPAIGEQIAYNPMPPLQGWYSINGAIWFDRDAEPSFAFTNFYVQPVAIGNYHTGKTETWPAVENYFQAMKTNDAQAHKKLQTLLPWQAVDEGGKLALLNPAQWDASKRFEVMRRALQAKFAPGTPLGNLLVSTKGRVLVEKTFGRTHPERVWGADDGFNGQNHLGRMLMVIRDSMEGGTWYPYDPINSYTLDKILKVLAAKQPLTAAR